MSTEDGHTRPSRRLAAILAADIAGYSTLMGADEARTVVDLKGHQTVVLPMIGQFGGRIIDTAGDGILAEFNSVANAVECAVAIQDTMRARNAEAEAHRKMQYRIGINLGDVIYDDSRIYGDGINVAARLVVLRHKLRRERAVFAAAQEGQRESRVMRSTTSRRRNVAIELGTWRSGLSGGASGSITFG